MSHILKLDILAEGVEDENQRDFLLENGCHDLQGYLYAKPMNSDLTYKFIEENQKD